MSTNPIAVITGATSGIGQLAAIELARSGYHLALTARNEERAETTRTLIRNAVPNAAFSFFFGDLSVLKDVQRLGKEINAVYPAIELVVNNAGLHGFKQRITHDDLPEMISVNYLAPWLLTRNLLPALSAAGHARIVNVASEASRHHGELRLPEDLTDGSEFTAKGSSSIYGKTKLLNIMFTAELARRLAGTKITVHAVNPGFNVTGLGRELSFSGTLSKALRFLHIGDPKRGADIIVRLALEPQYERVSGGYYNVGSGKPIVPVYPGDDSRMQGLLWNATEDLLKKRGFQ